MVEFLVTVLAIVVAQVVVIGFVFGICMNQRFIKWWTKKYIKMVGEIQEDMVDVFNGEEL